MISNALHGLGPVSSKYKPQTAWKRIKSTSGELSSFLFFLTEKQVLKNKNKKQVSWDRRLNLNLHPVKNIDFLHSVYPYRKKLRNILSVIHAGFASESGQGDSTRSTLPWWPLVIIHVIFSPVLSIRAFTYVLALASHQKWSGSSKTHFVTLEVKIKYY